MSSNNQVLIAAVPGPLAKGHFQIQETAAPVCRFGRCDEARDELMQWIKRGELVPRYRVAGAVAHRDECDSRWPISRMARRAGVHERPFNHRTGLLLLDRVIDACVAVQC